MLEPLIRHDRPLCCRGLNRCLKSRCTTKRLRRCALVAFIVCLTSPFFAFFINGCNIDWPPLIGCPGYRQVTAPVVDINNSIILFQIDPNQQCVLSGDGMLFEINDTRLVLIKALLPRDQVVPCSLPSVFLMHAWIVGFCGVIVSLVSFSVSLCGSILLIFHDASYSKYIYSWKYYWYQRELEQIKNLLTNYLCFDTQNLVTAYLYESNLLESENNFWLPENT